MLRYAIKDQNSGGAAVVNQADCRRCPGEGSGVDLLHRRHTRSMRLGLAQVPTLSVRIRCVRRHFFMGGKQ